MSQAKVDKYKESKTKRKENAQKDRRRRKMVRWITILVIALVAAAVIIAIVITGRNEYQSYQDAAPDYTQDSALIITDMNGILPDDEAADDVETAPADEAETEPAG